jgi:hypothetical protein
MAPDRLYEVTIKAFLRHRRHTGSYDRRERFVYLWLDRLNLHYSSRPDALVWLPNSSSAFTAEDQMIASVKARIVG